MVEEKHWGLRRERAKNVKCLHECKFSTEEKENKNRDGVQKTKLRYILDGSLGFLKAHLEIAVRTKISPINIKRHNTYANKGAH